MPEETFGELLRRLRERAGYSQDAFADAVELSRKTIQTIENGRGRPTFKKEVQTVTRMAEVLGQPVPLLSTKLGWLPASISDNPLADAEAAIHSLDLSEDEKQAIITLLRGRARRTG